MYNEFPENNVDQFVIDSKKDVEELLLSEPPELKKGLLELLAYLKENGYMNCRCLQL
ncbi:MAG: hypothetical protein U5K84_01410 [Alkalibacterium sp.]|nr:hypothetical protein [Alkalibacterium sp.]